MSSKEMKSAITNFLAGGVGGMCATAAGFPMDTVKVRLQTMPIVKPGERPLYLGSVDCLKQTVNKNGVLGLFRGMGTPMLAATPMFAMCFLGNSIGKRIQQDHPGQELSLLQLVNAGMFSGIFSTVFMAPGERIKCLLQIQTLGTANVKYSGPLDCAKQLLREGGIRSIYKGTAATLLRDIPASGAFFGGYELTQRLLTGPGERREDVGVARTLLAGGVGGVSNWIIALPADVLKSRLQTAPEGTYRRGIRDVFVQLMREEGPGALFRGLGPALLRAFPANAACFLGYEVALSQLNAVSSGW